MNFQDILTYIKFVINYYHFSNTASDLVDNPFSNKYDDINRTAAKPAIWHNRAASEIPCGKPIFYVTLTSLDNVERHVLPYYIVKIVV